VRAQRVLRRVSRRKSLALPRLTEPQLRWGVEQQPRWRIGSKQREQRLVSPRAAESLTYTDVWIAWGGRTRSCLRTGRPHPDQVVLQIEPIGVPVTEGQEGHFSVQLAQAPSRVGGVGTEVVVQPEAVSAASTWARPAGSVVSRIGSAVPPG